MDGQVQIRFSSPEALGRSLRGAGQGKAPCQPPGAAVETVDGGTDANETIAVRLWPAAAVQRGTPTNVELLNSGPDPTDNRSGTALKGGAAKMTRRS